MPADNILWKHMYTSSFKIPQWCVEFSLKYKFRYKSQRIRIVLSELSQYLCLNLT